MDMKINKEVLRRERELRAWTQSHLAEVANLSMRTVQRIERTGDVSMESASALVAALNMELDKQFRMSVNTKRQGEDLLFSAKIYHFAYGEYRLFSSSAMLVKNEQPASMRVIFPDGQRINLQLVADF